MQKIIMILFLGVPLGYANQINMANVRKVASAMKAENNAFDSREEQDLDEPIDFGTEGELNMEELKSSEFLIWFNKYCISPFFGLYNWFQRRSEMKHSSAER